MMLFDCVVWEVRWKVRCVFCVLGFVVFEESVCVYWHWGLWLPA